MKLIRLFPLLALLVLMAISTAMAAEGDASAGDSVNPSESAGISDAGGIVVDAETFEPIAAPAPEGPTELDYLVSINTYVTYLFGFGLVVICVLFYVLVYKFFNMFF